MQLKQSLLIFVLVLTVVAGCVTSGTLTDIPLVWKPTDDIYDIETATLTSLYTKKSKLLSSLISAKINLKSEGILRVRSTGRSQQKTMLLFGVPTDSGLFWVSSD